MCEFHVSSVNGFGDIWWTDKLIYFSSIDVKGTRHNYEKIMSANLHMSTYIIKKKSNSIHACYE